MCGLDLTQAIFDNFSDKPNLLFDQIGVVKEDSFADLVNNTHTCFFSERVLGYNWDLDFLMARLD